MKRLLLPASALVLVVTACGAGVKPAPRVAEAATKLPSVHALVVERKRAALREARSLLREFVPPRGARRSRRGNVNFGAPAPLGEFAGAHRLWQARGSLDAVVAFLETHDPRGFRDLSSTYGTQRPHSLIRTLAHGPNRYLDETVVALPGRTLLRVDARVAWVYPRPATEEVPAATREIDIRTPAESRGVKSPAEVATISRWFDALPVSPPGIVVACPAEPAFADSISLSFRNSAGTQLAHATVPATRAWFCDPIGFTIGGRPQRPLVDRSSGESFARRLLRLTRTR